MRDSSERYSGRVRMPSGRRNSNPAGKPRVNILEETGLLGMGTKKGSPSAPSNEQFVHIVARHSFLMAVLFTPIHRRRDSPHDLTGVRISCLHLET